MKVLVTFTEVVTRTVPLDLEELDGMSEADAGDLLEEDIYEIIDREQAWDQVTKEAWLGGDVDQRNVDDWQFSKADSKLGAPERSYDV